MAQPDIRVIDDILHTDPTLFERGVRALEAGTAGADEGDKFLALTSVLDGLNARDNLGPAELSRRSRVVLDLARLSDGRLPNLASAARAWRPELKNAVAAVLPPRWRRLVYERQTTSAATAASATPETAAPPASPAPVPPPAALDAAHTPASRDEGGCRTVLLLGAFQDHEGNQALLVRHGFTPLRAADEDALGTLLTAEVCGIVVARSWWASLPPARHREVLHRLLQHSTFAWTRIDTTGLSVPARDVPALCRSARFEEPGAFELACHESGHIAAVDVPCLERACGWLATPATVRLCPAEIGEEQARLLLGAAAKHVDGRHFPGPVRLSKVEAGPLAGGRSEARIVRIAPDDGGPALIAKIDTLPLLQEEVRRFREFIAWWDTGLSPRLHFHAGTGLVLFALVEDHGQPGQPAPTLEERLEEALYDELWTGPRQGPAEGDLGAAIDRAVQKLERLNARCCVGSTVPSLGVPLDAVDAILQRGITWTIPDCEGVVGDVFAYRRRARRLIGNLARYATVHGDIHLRNILVRDDRDPHFIDYACSGPGHPCFDLVRLESALLFRCFRLTAEECLTARLLRSLLEGSDETTAATAFPTLLTSIGNRLAVRAAVRCQEAALRLLQPCHGTLDDYLAVKYIVACQALLDHQQQTGVVRCALAALTTVMRGRETWRTVDEQQRDAVGEEDVHEVL